MLCRTMCENLRSADASLLECGLCRSRLHDPRTLSCLHMFCLKCLKAYASPKQPGDQLSCPVCHGSFHIPDKGIEDLQSNGFVERLLKAEENVGVLQNNTRELCDSCSEETNIDVGHAVKIDVAKYYCLPCKTNLCSTCRIRHTNSQPDMTHHLVESSTRHEQQSLAKQPSYCSAHRDKEIVVYCRDCSVAICEQCFTEQHGGHAWSDVETAAEEFRQRIQQDIERVKDHLRIGQDRMRALEEQRRRLEDLDDIERIINERSEELKAVVDNDTNRLLMSLEEMKKRATEGASGDRLSTEMEGEGSSSEREMLERLQMLNLDGLVPINLMFTASQICADDRNLIGRLVTFETSETVLSDDVAEETEPVNTDSGLRKEGTDADG